MSLYNEVTEMQQRSGSRGLTGVFYNPSSLHLSIGNAKPTAPVRDFPNDFTINSNPPEPKNARINYKDTVEGIQKDRLFALNGHRELPYGPYSGDAMEFDGQANDPNSRGIIGIRSRASQGSQFFKPKEIFTDPTMSEEPDMLKPSAKSISGLPKGVGNDQPFNQPDGMKIRSWS